MPKTSSKNAYLLIGGSQLSPMASAYEVDYNNTAIEVTGFTDGWQNFIPGIMSGQMSVNMYWNEAANSVHDALHDLDKKAVSIFPEGSAEGNWGFTMWADNSNYQPQGNPDSAITVGSIVFQAASADGGPMPCQLLMDGTITTTTSSTATKDVTDADITARCAGVLHIYTAPANDRYAIVIQSSSAEAGSYTDLVTFTLNGSAIGSEVVHVASSTFKEWWKVTATRTGAGNENFGFAVAFWHSNM